MSVNIQSVLQSERSKTAKVKLASFSPAFRSFSEDYKSTSPSKDQSEIRQAEIQKLRDRNTELSHLVDIMPNGVVVLDAKGMVSQANKVAISLLGEPLEGEKWRTVIGRSFKPREDDGHEVSLRNGRRVKLEITPLKSGQLIVMTDLTETRILQERISHLQRVSALGRMVASLAHQIRTPLSAAMLYAANLKNSRLKVDQRLNFVDKLSSRLSDLEKQVNDMLMFAKSGENQVLEQVSLQQLLTSVHQSSDAMVSLAGDLTVDLPEPDICLLANKTSLSSAITNLIHNAVQVVGQGVHVHVAAQRDKIKPNRVIISVEDNGPGVEKNLINKIFEPFYTTRSQGTGLGLSVVKTVAQAHQGHVEVENKPGGGAIFRMYLPIKLNALAPIDVSTQQEEVV
ncbi:GHKL domain-containing protein [Psychrosphaera sp. B3R10]|uniref:sensor histidine kinase n=1 Tax=unclassified Psychrosphaera TaxID=2641570 RepID=UPI001C095703|nr:MULTISPECIES: ATP-binding protein [unclassified Psychrosphaera]MBU2883507.1 GHKL domain-containing protein [Psychrosphaera sp. I2R16]MBU2989686.1 GHKL domain-containing protein [Psychrosphaera sp. B3R10]